MGLKRFLFFGLVQYYPSGGWGDFEGDYDTVEEARAFIAKDKTSPDGGSEQYEIIDSETKKEVE